MPSSNDNFYAILRPLYKTDLPYCPTYRERNGSSQRRRSVWKPQLFGSLGRLTQIQHLCHSVSTRRASVALLSFVICCALLIRVKSMDRPQAKVSRTEPGEQLESLQTSEHAHPLFRWTPDFPRGPEFSIRRKLTSLEVWQTQRTRLNPVHATIADEISQHMSPMRHLTGFSMDLEGALEANSQRTMLQSGRDFRSQPKKAPGSTGNLYRSEPVPQRNSAQKVGSALLSNQLLHNVPCRKVFHKGQAQNSKLGPGYEAQGGISNHGKRASAHADVPYRDALEALRDATTIASLKSTGQSEQDSSHSTVQTKKPKVTLRSSQPVNSPLAQPPPPSTFGRKEHHTSFKSKTMTMSEGMIEIWALHSGGSLCRIFNVGRLPNGRLLLPLWMKKRLKILLQQCGVKDPVFAVKAASDDDHLVLEKKGLNVTGEICVINDANRDLFSSNIPRHHMPHFVSDLLFPLAATEILKGPGSTVAKQEFIRMNSSSPPFEANPTAFPYLNPSLFLSEETWQAEPSVWVRRFVNFLSHPEVGFELLAEKEEPRRCHGASYNKSNVIWRFRSVLSGNLNVNEAEGLFNAHGNNYVFSRNRLSEGPAWAIHGISQDPCRVAVTALTRSGPRALLNLDLLRNTAENKFTKGGLQLDFKVVKFENAEFETQVRTMQHTNVLIATHGAGNANLIFTRRGATIIEVFPFAYRAGPFNALARTFGLDYKTAMSSPQTKVFKDCMDQYETNNDVKQKVFGWWDKAVEEERLSPWIHRLELEKEFGAPGKAEGMATRRCVRMQQLDFDTNTVAGMVFESAKRQCGELRILRRTLRMG